MPTFRKTIRQHRSQRVGIFAVKVDGEGWVGVSSDLGRCHGHGHETPELAKLCAFHLAAAPPPGSNVVLLPVTVRDQRARRRIAGA